MDTDLPRSRRRSQPAAKRTRFSIGAQVSAAEYQRIEEEWLLRGCSPSDLVRSALRLDNETPHRPLLVAAGQLIRAGNAHAAAMRRGDWNMADRGVEQLTRHAIELIRLAIEEQSAR